MRGYAIRAFFAILSLLLPGFASLYAQGQTQPALATVQTPPIRELIVSATLNGAKIADSIEALDVNGLGVLLTRSEFDRLNLVGVKPRVVTRGASEYVALSRTPGLRVSLDVLKLELAIVAETDLFAATKLSMGRREVVEPTRESGVFANYDLSAIRAGDDKTYSGFLELVGFTPWGSLISTGVTTYVNGVTMPVRLDTAFQREFPSQRTRLRIGDSATVAGQFGSVVRFGGIQYGTEDAVDPRFVWRPLLSFNGTATVPSTIDVFLNSGFQRRFDVPPGSFTVEDISTITGRGNARIVVRDATGREVVIDQPFFTLPGQLRQGVSRYSASAGWLRNQYGTASHDYGAFVGSGFWRYGLTSTVTTELRVEMQKNGPAVVGASVLLPLASGHSISLFSGASRALGQMGYSTGVAYNFASTRFSLGVQADHSDARYRTLGSTDSIPNTKLRVAATAGANLGELGSASAAYVRTESATQAVSQQASINYFYPLTKELRLSTGYTHSLSEPRFWSAYLGLSWYSGNGLSASVTGRASCDALCESQGARFDTQAVIASRTDGVSGLNWQLDGARGRARASAEWLGSHGIVAAEAFGGTRAQRGGRVGARGSVAFIDGTVAAGQPIQDSFLLVRSPDAAGAQVLTSSSRGTALDRSGTALLPRVVGYDPVNVRLRQEDVPINVTVSQAPVVVAVPSKAGAVARITSRKTAPATFTLIDLSRKFISVGTEVTLGVEKVKVGLDGLVYIEGYEPGARGTARSASRRCDFVLPPAASADIMPYLGEIQCDLRAR